MERIALLDGPLMQRLIAVGARRLENHQSAVNALNVFPVPDGDTGSNMAATMAAAWREAERSDASSLGAVAAAAARGSLMGARGNSGVILSQLYRGFAKALEGKNEASPADLARALQEGVRTAYEAVMKPVEGTILTVSREASRGAQESARAGADLAGVLRAALQAAEAALARTPELLPVLKKAGVVDSGGKGYCVILEGYLEALGGGRESVSAEAAVSAAAAAQPAMAVGAPVDFALTEDLADIRFPYDCEFFVRGQNLPLDEMRRRLAAWGDCVLVVGSQELAKVHVHTDNPGPVFDYCVRLGDVINIDIKNMKEQHAELQHEAHHHPETYRAAVAVVAVAAGDGLAEIFRSLGAQVVEGGQSMNPSTEELVRAIEAAPADRVVILPNNKNIQLAAQQARDLVPHKSVQVVPTVSVPEGIAAVLAWNPEQADLPAVAAAMQQAAARVQSGEVTWAVRDCQFDQMSVRGGDVLGLRQGRLETVGADPAAVLLDLVQRMEPPDGAIVTVYYGAGVAAEQAAAAGDRLKAALPQAEVELQYGGQPLYFYLVSVE